jgi:phenylpyruvate tautomerase
MKYDCVMDQQTSLSPLYGPLYDAAVSINDNASVIFGGSDEPAALGCMYSIGAIAQESNGSIQKSVTDLLEPFGVDEGRIYINFFDVPRANVGWKRRTFAG